MTSYLLLKVEHSKPIPDLTDIAAGRLYCLDRVDDVTARLMEPRDAVALIETLDMWERARRG